MGSAEDHPPVGLCCQLSKNRIEVAKHLKGFERFFEIKMQLFRSLDQAANHIVKTKCNWPVLDIMK